MRGSSIKAYGCDGLGHPLLWFYSWIVRSILYIVLQSEESDDESVPCKGSRSGIVVAAETGQSDRQ